MRAGPSHTTTPGTQQHPVQQVTQKNQSTDPKIHGPIPQDPTARLDDSLHHHHVPRLIPKESAVLASAVSLHI
ncbi:hypothetical protein GCM10009744_65300 [Kribbella alba]|uniref:Uncharacterized protein n=1 Tax=Kribbella alba TaxID=190197 RepID=A0ABP4RX51_9ACTN